RLYTDAIDNSAGVNCSDHEVNIKILLDGIVAQGDMTVKQRNELLASMTDDVAKLVLRQNYLQPQAIELSAMQATANLSLQQKFMQYLESEERLDRAIEFLPSDEEIARRQKAGQGLTNPELSVLLAYGKMWVYDH
ncbi:NAD-glutamate dehydrogenase domain-containing protein, partial [Pasteurella multocida]|uniref:NAD-glutamate dehydrogenase domain-containing protein n=1 Tax=Pasteurella multocida TaxID=747 RepID=UPI00227B951B